MKIDIKSLRIGSDFEVFITDEDNNFISAIPYVDGTKDNPQVITAEGHAIQHDGALLEGNVPPVTLEERDAMWDNIQLVLEAFQNRLPGNLKVKCCPNGEFSDDQLTDPEARRFGCDPDFNAWKGGDINKKPDADETNKRCCGVHFHFSFPGATPKNVVRLIRIFDVRLALPMLLIDDDRERRKLYGKAGCFRFKDYGSAAGVEYRTLSNSVIKERAIFNLLWDGIKQSISEYNKGIDYLEYSDEIQEALNEYNLELATDLAEVLNITMYEIA